jgi:dipeptidyl aminopeptidase/acylaminoacyl peptidase
MSCALVALAAHAAGAAPPDIARFVKIRAPRSPVVAPDGTVYAIDWPDGIRQLHRRAARTLDAPWERLTDMADGISGFALAPDGRTIVVSAAVGGNEQTGLYRIDAASGATSVVRNDPDVVHRFERWTADSRAFFYAANDENPADFHLYRHDLATGASQRVLAESGWWTVADVSDDGNRLLVGRFFSESHAEAFELTLAAEEGAPGASGANGGLRRIDVEEGAFNEPVAYMLDQASMLVLSDHDGGINRLYLRDAESGDATRPRPDLDPFPIDSAIVNRERTLAAVVVNEGGFGRLHVIELSGFAEVPMAEIADGVVGEVDIRGRLVSWTLSSAGQPGVGYVAQAGRPDAVRPITRAADQGIDLAAFVAPSLVAYPSFDGREIPAFLYLPLGAAGPVPFVVSFHGGPEGQHRPGFNAVIQYLLARGYGVMQPNVRGSTGYGRAYHMLDDAAGRWDSVRDGVAAVRWLIERGHAAPRRVATYGGSYGGFMAVATAIEGRDVVGACVDVVGIVNFETFLAQTKDYRRALREAEYGSLDDPAFLASISPIHRIDEIDAPTLIAHGLNDPRVPIGEAMQLAVGLQTRGHDPELLFFPDEGHGFAKEQNRILFYERMAKFLDRTIGGGAARDR